MAILADQPREAELKDEIISLASHINAAEYRFCVLIEEYDRLEYFRTWDCPSMTAWLSWHTGMRSPTARDHVRVARALPGLPRVAQAFSTGELSYSKVRAVTRVADEYNEEPLLGMARAMTAGQLDMLVAGIRRVARSAEAGKTNDLAKKVFFTSFFDSDGMLVVNARFLPEDGALINNAMEAAKLEIPPANPDQREDLQERVSRNRADSFVELCRRSMSTTQGGSPAAVETVVHVDARLLGPEFETVAEDPAVLSRIDSGPHLAPETIQRLVCDGPVRVLAELDGEPLNIGRRSRAWPWPMRVAIHAKYKGCFWPGCERTKGNDIHHCQWWSLGGETSVENGIEVCRHHHRAIHEGGYRLERGEDGNFILLKPDGSPLATVPDTAPPARAIEEVLPGIDPKVSKSQWDGGHLDLSWTTALLFHNWQLAKARKQAEQEAEAVAA